MKRNERFNAKPKKHWFKKFLLGLSWPFRKVFKLKETWVIFSIIMSYVMSYVAPIFIFYIYARDKFFKETIIGPRYTLAFLGFVIVSIIFTLAVLIKIVIKMVKSKPSYTKYSIAIFLWLIVLIPVVFVLLKFHNFIDVIEAASEAFFNGARGFIIKVKNSILIFISCITISNIFKMIAISIDKEYVERLDWL